jgi:hypothetical protein
VSTEDVGRTGYLSVVMSVQAGNLSVAAGEGAPASAHPTSLAPPLSTPMVADEDRATPATRGSRNVRSGTRGRALQPDGPWR